MYVLFLFELEINFYSFIYFFRLQLLEIGNNNNTCEIGAPARPHTKDFILLYSPFCVAHRYRGPVIIFPCTRYEKWDVDLNNERHGRI